MTFTSALRACGTLGTIDKGEILHDEITQQELLENISVLMNMHAKCDVFTKAERDLTNFLLNYCISVFFFYTSKVY